MLLLQIAWYICVRSELTFAGICGDWKFVHMRVSSLIALRFIFFRQSLSWSTELIILSDLHVSESPWADAGVLSMLTEKGESSIIESLMPQCLTRWWLEVVSRQGQESGALERKVESNRAKSQRAHWRHAPRSHGCPMMTARLSIARRWLSQRSSSVSPWASHQRCLALSSYKTHQAIEELWWYAGSDLGIIYLLVFFENVLAYHFFWTKTLSAFRFICEA